VNSAQPSSAAGTKAAKPPLSSDFLFSFGRTRQSGTSQCFSLAKNLQRRGSASEQVAGSNPVLSSKVLKNGSVDLLATLAANSLRKFCGRRPLRKLREQDAGSAVFSLF
jgi:hypothetical protein